MHYKAIGTIELGTQFCGLVCVLWRVYSTLVAIDLSVAGYKQKKMVSDDKL